MSRKPKSDYAIQTVTNALRLLETFRDEDEIGVAELSRRLGLHKNNVFRLLATLEQSGYIEQSSSTDRYRLGVATHELGRSFLRGRSLVERARPTLDWLVEHTGETAHLAMLDGFDVVHLDGRTSDRVLTTALRVGRRAPVHCTAMGKALLGCSPERVWQEFDRTMVSKGRLETRTAQTIDDPDKFFENLRMVASHGFAVDLGEFEDGLACAAAPIHGADGEVVGAFSVSAPLERVGEDALIREVCPEVMDAASRLSVSLGYSA